VTALDSAQAAMPWPVVPARRLVRQAGNVKPVPG